MHRSSGQFMHILRRAEWRQVTQSVGVNRTWSALLEELVEVQRRGPGVGFLGPRRRGGRLLRFLHRIFKRSAGVGPGRKNKTNNEINKQHVSSEYLHLCAVAGWCSPRPRFCPHVWVQVLRQLCDQGHVKWTQTRQTFGLVWVVANEKQPLPCGTTRSNPICVKWLNQHCTCQCLFYYHNISKHSDALCLQNIVSIYEEFVGATVWTESLLKRPHMFHHMWRKRKDSQHSDSTLMFPR